MSTPFNTTVITEIIPHHQVFSFLKEAHVNNYRLLWYDFFVIIPWKNTMPSMSLDVDFSDSKLSNLELIGLTFIDIFDTSKLRDHLEESIKISTLVDYIKIYQNALDYLNWDKTDAYIGYEFVYRNSL